MVLKKMFNALNSLSMCISSSHSFNPRLSSHEILIPNNCSVWIRNGSYGWAFTLLVLHLILSIFAGPFIHWMSYLHAFCVSRIFYMHYFVLILLLCFSFVWVKTQNHIKSEKFKKIWSYMFVHISHVRLAQYLHTNGVVHLRA